MEEMTFENLIYEGESARFYGTFELAYNYFSRAIMLQPTNPEPHQKMGIAKIDNRDYEGALNDFNNAITLDDQNWAYYYDRGFIYYELRYYENSVADYSIALKLIDNFPEDKDRQLDWLLNRMAKAQLKQGDFKGAIDTLTQSIALKTDKMWVVPQICERAQAKEQLGLIEEALVDYNLAIINYQKWNGKKDKEIQEIESIIMKLSKTFDKRVDGPD